MHFVINDLQISCEGHEIEELIADKDGIYSAYFSFDSSWKDLNKTARFICTDDEYYDSLIGPENTCPIPNEALFCKGTLQVVVFAGEYGESLLTEAPASVRIIRSLITDGRRGLPGDPNPAIYTQIANAAADALKIAKSVEERANSGEFNGASVTDAIRVWQPDTKYTVEDYCLAPCFVNDLVIYALCTCIKEHISSKYDGPLNLLPELWQVRDITTSQSYKDIVGNIIHETYATKEEVGDIESALDNIIAIQDVLINGGNG